MKERERGEQEIRNLPGGAVYTRRLYPPSVPAVYTRRLYPPSIPAVCTRRLYPPSIPAVCTRRLYPPSIPAIYTRRLYPPSIPAVCTRRLYPPSVPAVCTCYPRFLHPVFIEDTRSFFFCGHAVWAFPHQRWSPLSIICRFRVLDN